MIRTILGVVLLLLLSGVRATESGAPATAGPAVLVRDFFPGEHEGGHPPPQMTKLGQTLFFVGDDRDSGPSVWRSDGTPSGSFQVHIQQPTECVFSSTDGTPAGTGPVPALASRFTGADQTILGAFAARWLVFSVGPAVYAYDVTTGEVRTLLSQSELVRTYGVGAFLYLREENRLWSVRLDAPEPRLLFEGPHLGIAGWREDTFYFVPENGRLWSTDGRTVRPFQGDRLESFSVLATPLGAVHSRTLLSLPGYYTGGLYAADDKTRDLREIHHVCSGKYGCGSQAISAVTAVGDQALLAIFQRLWHSDGTPAGTQPHPTLGAADAESFRVFDHRLVLGATSKEGEQRLWATDGGAPGTVALSDGDLPFRIHGAPERLGDALYAAGSRKPVGEQLWRIADGRATAVTSQRHFAKGLQPGRAYRAGSTWVVQGDLPGWRGIAASGATELLPLDVVDCLSIEVNPCPFAAVAMGRRFLFATANYQEMAATDGTAAGTHTLPLEDPDGVASVVSSLGLFRNRALILGDAGGLWTSEGTPAGTRFVVQLPIPPAPLPPGRGVDAPVAVGSLSFLFRRVPIPGDPARSALELWRTDGTAAGTLRLASIPFDKRANPYPAPTPLAGRLFFRAFGTLWVSDGSVAGTRPLPRQLPGGTFALSAGTTTLYTGAGYLVPNQPQTLWAIDPETFRETPLGAFSSLYPSYPGAPLGNLVGDTLFFFTEDSAGSAWWRSEGTPGSTIRLPELLASQPIPAFVTLGDRRYFPACDVEHGCELWSTDRLGEDTRLVQDLWAGPRSSYPYILGTDEHSLWFAATEPAVGNELWRLDLPAAAAAGTRLSPSSLRAAPPAARVRALRARRAQEPPWKRRLR